VGQRIGKVVINVDVVLCGNRRGFAAAATATQSATRGGASISGNITPKSGEEKVRGVEKVAWVPDPVTGYYKPENTNEIDVADLRAMVLGKKFNN